MKKVLVTGGAGFIGSELTKLLLRKKHHVTVFDNFSTGSRAHVWQGATSIRGDLCEPKDLKKLRNNTYDLVFHMAALHFIPYCNAHPDQTIATNVHGTQNLLQELSHRLPRRIFFASTAAVYAPSDRPHQEKEPPQPMDIYGVTKLAGEHLLRLFSTSHAVDCVVGRLFNAYGPRETNPHLIPSLFDQLKNGSRTVHLGNLKPCRDYMHTQDMAQAIYLLATKPLLKSFTVANVGSGKERSVEQVVAAFEKALGYKLSVKTKTHLVRKVERMHLSPNLTELRKLTGFSSSVTFSEGIKNMVEDL